MRVAAAQLTPDLGPRRTGGVTPDREASRMHPTSPRSPPHGHALHLPHVLKVNCVDASRRRSLSLSSLARRLLSVSRIAAVLGCPPVQGPPCTVNKSSLHSLSTEVGCLWSWSLRTWRRQSGRSRRCGCWHRRRRQRRRRRRSRRHRPRTLPSNHRKSIGQRHVGCVHCKARTGAIDKEAATADNVFGTSDVRLST